jgi:hypothetical protein
MDAQQTKIVFLVAVFAAAAWFIAPFLAGERATDLPVVEHASRFDAARCLSDIGAFVTRNPRRLLGSLESRQSTAFLQKAFAGLGYQVSYSHFDAVIGGKIEVGRNVLAHKPGRSHETVAVVAHYDTAPTTVQGAMDDGSGIGVMIELARLLGSSEHARSLLFVATDGEEWGMLGARDIAAGRPQLAPIAAVLSLDYVAAGWFGRFAVGATGQFSGYSPPWLRSLVERAAADHAVRSPSGIVEHLERALLFSRSDQGPFLAAGIPSVNLGSSSADEVRERDIYHSASDTIENLTESGIAIYGETAEKIVRTLLDAPELPHESMGFFRVTQNRFFAPWLMAALQALLFAPYGTVLYFHVANHWRYLSGVRVLRELSALFAALLPLLFVAPAVMFLRLPGLRMVPGYSLYPGGAKYPGLVQARWGVVAGVAAAAAICAVVLYFVHRLLTKGLPRPDFYVSKLMLLLVFGIVLAAAAAYNPYWAVSFLLLPSLVWGLIAQPKTAGERAANLIWIVAAGIVFYSVVVLSADRLGVGIAAPWAGVLGLSSGMLHPKGFLLACAGIAVGIRFLAIQFIRVPGVQPEAPSPKGRF